MMVIIKKTNSNIRGFFKKIGSVSLVIFGFLLVFFAASSRSFGVASNGSVFGAVIAHADAPTGDGSVGFGGGSPTSVVSDGGSGCGGDSGGCGGSGGGGGCGSCGGCASGGSDCSDGGSGCDSGY